MGRITARWPVTKLTVGHEAVVRPDLLAVEEPLEIRIAGTPLTVTMRTPGHDVELAAGFLVAEGVIERSEQFVAAIHCGGPGTAGAHEDGAELNSYNVLDIALGAGARVPGPESARNFLTSSACGVCGKTSIDSVRSVSAFNIAADSTRLDAAFLTQLPERLRDGQRAFDATGGLHGAALFDAATGHTLVVREDVGRHNAVDKVIGWALTQGRLPLSGTVLQVSGRASFELVQKAVMAGIPVLAAVSAPSSLAAELAKESGLTLIGFLRGDSMNIYTHPERIR